MISSYFERGRFAQVMRASRSLLGGAGESQPPREPYVQVLTRALARGDLREDIDRDLILDLLGSLIHYRALFGHAPTCDAEIEHAVEALLRGIATDYPRLLEHTLSMAGDPEIHHLHTETLDQGGTRPWKP
jgi:hypothetical protein